MLDWTQSAYVIMAVTAFLFAVIVAAWLLRRYTRTGQAPQIDAISQPAPKRARAQPTRKALLVGISEYDNFPTLRNSKSDVIQLAKVLREKYAFDVTEITGRVSAKGLRDARADFIKAVNIRDAEIVLVAISGHGFAHEPGEYIIPSDSKFGEVIDDFVQECLDQYQTVTLARAAERAHRIFIFDCCRLLLPDEVASRVQHKGRPVPNWVEREYFVTATQKGDPAKDASSLMKAISTSLENVEISFRTAINSAIEQVATQGAQRPNTLQDGSLFYNWHLRPYASPYAAPPSELSPNHHTGSITAMALDPHGIHVAVAIRRKRIDDKKGDPGSEIHCFYSKSKKAACKPFAHEATIYTLDFSPSGTEIIYGTRDGKVGRFALLERHSSKRSHEIEAFKSPVNHVEWARATNRIIAVSANSHIKLLEPVDLVILAEGQAHKSDIWSASFHPDGRRVVTGSKDRTIRLWDLAAFGSEQSRLTPVGAAVQIGSPIRALRFDNLGRTLGVGTQSGELILLEFNEITNEFSKKERISPRRVLPEAKYEDGRPRLDENKVLRYFRQRPYFHRRRHAGDPKTIADITNPLCMLALDFSPDRRVLVYGTNIDGYSALDIGATPPVRLWGTDDYREKLSKSFRCQEVRFCRERQRLYLASGAEVHILQF